MAEEFLAPSPATAAKIADALARPDAASKGPGGVPGVTPTAIVRRGDHISDTPVPHYEGWLRGHPELDPGEATDLGTQPVILVALDGGELEEDEEYVAVRAGSAGGVPVYRTQAAGGLDALEQNCIDASHYDIVAEATWEDASGGDDTKKLHLPSAGTYFLYAMIAGQATGIANTLGKPVLNVYARLYDETYGGAIDGGERLVCQAQSWDTTSTTRARGTAVINMLYTVTEPTVMRVEVFKNVGLFTSTTAFVENASFSSSHFGYLKVG